MTSGSKEQGERQVLDWLAGQQAAMVALLETLVNTDSEIGRAHV